MSPLAHGETGTDGRDRDRKSGMATTGSGSKPGIGEQVGAAGLESVTDSPATGQRSTAGSTPSSWQTGTRGGSPPGIASPQEEDTPERTGVPVEEDPSEGRIKGSSRGDAPRTETDSSATSSELPSTSVWTDLQTKTGSGSEVEVASLTTSGDPPSISVWTDLQTKTGPGSEFEVAPCRTSGDPPSISVWTEQQTRTGPGLEAEAASSDAETAPSEVWSTLMVDTGPKSVDSGTAK